MAAVPTRTPGRGHPRYDISKRHASPGLQSKLNLDAETRILLRDIVTQNQSPFALLNYGNRLVGKHNMATAASMQSNARFRACKAPSRLSLWPDKRIWCTYDCSEDAKSWCVGPGRGITSINPSKTMQKKPLAISLAYVDTTASSRVRAGPPAPIMIAHTHLPAHIHTTISGSICAFFSRTILDLPGEGKIRFSMSMRPGHKSIFRPLAKDDVERLTDKPPPLRARSILATRSASGLPLCLRKIRFCNAGCRSPPRWVLFVSPTIWCSDRILFEAGRRSAHITRAAFLPQDSLSFTKHSQPNAGQWATRPPVVRNMLIRLFLFADRFMTSVSVMVREQPERQLRDRDLHRRIASATPLAISRSAKESGRRTDYEDGSPLARYYPCPCFQSIAGPPWGLGSTMCLPCQVSVACLAFCDGMRTRKAGFPLETTSC
ncbi:uncharacterized protein CLUP02_00803 [Colletotrichum lupini]|uniref:Uncharacterized protein n=1 Tax=Colletotrichum lupini TaxID=145971 RepID=A0A9Q8SBU4_9PEZI|nr:uncharacterized protein CLUP02_00803 [Colletotrichum lupini]UQC74155.1 hypothetical protein CLUP02_00803 [Colletotrichum lupini]